MLIVSAILVAGIFCAGCTDSGSAATQSGSSPGSDVQTRSPISANTASPSTTPAQVTGAGDGKQGNQSAAPPGTPPSGMMMNGTHPSGTPPSGSPPSGMAMNGTRPSGTPPAGGGQPPSGSPPLGTPPTGQ